MYEVTKVKEETTPEGIRVIYANTCHDGWRRHCPAGGHQVRGQGDQLSRPAGKDSKTVPIIGLAYIDILNTSERFSKEAYRYMLTNYPFRSYLEDILMAEK